ncbi:hypothetical protein Fcan01_18631 [Folsomia candida]|uniref:Uncharacterized protein n=1 Tax=Folsomia candida TaxID=158441 RepID=A0A226DML2_FOLCA|nr:hypothetical protein Fcan01_18631 [Folsomia candida]
MKPCCDRRTTVAMIAMIDMTFGVILFVLCFQSLFFVPIPAQFSHMPWTRLLLLFPIIVNTFQILISFNLLMSIRQIDLLISLAKTSIWLHGAFITFTCLVLKFIFLFFNLWTMSPSVFKSGDSSTNFLMTLTLWEMLTKIVSIYLIRSYLEELKLEAYPPPNVQFYSVYIPPSEISPSPSSPLIWTTTTPTPTNCAPQNEYKC